MIRALSGEQRNKTIIAAEPGGEVFTSAFRDNLELNYAGIRYDELSSPQHDLLLRLVELHVSRTRPDHAQVRMQEVKRHLRDTHFCWMGGMDDDSVSIIASKPGDHQEFDHQRGIAFRQYEKP